jgi:serine protease Do
MDTKNRAREKKRRERRTNMGTSSTPSRRTVIAVAIGFLIGGGSFGVLTKVTRLEARTGVKQWSSGLPGSAGSTGSGAVRVASRPYPPVAGTSFPDSGSISERLTSVFVNLASKVTPAVVQVEVRRPGTSPSEGIPDLPEPFRQFFDIPQNPNPPDRSVPKEMAGGTGFLISSDGYILTNAHVVDQADRIVVNLRDRTSHPAQVVGADPTTDLAVIKIEARDLPTLEWGSSRELQVGEPVMAVGNPGFAGSQSLDYTVTTGIVSAIGRPLSIIRQSLEGNPDLAGYAIENFIQTDAVINPGNSGGPLVDLWGRVVGVNSAIASSDGHYQGYGFAIPVDLAKKVSGDLIEHGRVRRGWLGVSVTEVSNEDAEVYRLPRVAGVLVQEVTDDSPADEAGLKVEDVVVAVGGTPIEDSGDLQEIVAELGPGAKVTLDLHRDGKRQIVPVRLGEAPFPAKSKPSPMKAEAGPEALLGMAVEDLTPALASELGFSRSEGVLVAQVIPWSPAMRKGVVPGMRIREVDHTPIGSAREFRQVMGDLGEGDVVTLLLESPDGSSRIVNLRADRR